MAKNKLKKFAELKTFDHVIEPPIAEPNKSFDLKGQWNKCFFKNKTRSTIQKATVKKALKLIIRITK